MSNDQQEGQQAASQSERKAMKASHPLRKKAITDESGRRSNAAARARKLAQKKSDAMPIVAPIDGPVLERDVDAPLASPSPAGGIVGVIQQPYLLRLLVRREIAKMYSASVLGLFWSYIQPAMRFGIYYAVFGILIGAHKDVPNFAIHLFCGIVFTHFFAEVFNGGTRSIWANRTLVKKMAMPREIFPVSHVIVGYYHIFPQILLLILFCFLSGFTFDLVGVVALVLGLLIISVFGMAVALLFSAVNVYYRDFQNIVGTINQLMHFMVPMMYPFTRVAKYADSYPILYQLYLANPVCTAVILLQRFFWSGVNNYDGDTSAATTMPPHLLERGVISLVVCAGFLYFCQWVFTRLESKFPERL